MVFDRAHALVIGVGSYSKIPQFNIPLTVGDARNIADVLCDRRYCCYPEQQVTLLHGETATRARILDELDRLTSLQDNETLLLFYSGHGSYGEDGYYLTTHETRFNGNKVAAGSGVGDRELLDKIQQIKAKRVFLIFNACHAGEVSPASLGDAGDAKGHNLPDEAALALLGTGEGRVIITACRNTQKSYFKPKNATMTMFARVLVEGLQGEGVRDRKGYISIFDLYEFVFNRVQAQAKSWGKVQEPELTIQKGIGAMTIALHQGKTTAGNLGFGDRLESSTGKVREVDLRESKRVLQQILRGEINLAASGDIKAVEVVRGDRINAENSQGFINRGKKIKQHFGNVTKISTKGGDYAGRDMYKSVSPVPNSTVSLREICDRLQQYINEAEKRGEEELVEDLESILGYLRSAIAAEDKGKRDRPEAKLKEAKKALESIIKNNPELNHFASLLQQVR